MSFNTHLFFGKFATVITFVEIFVRRFKILHISLGFIGYTTEHVLYPELLGERMKRPGKSAKYVKEPSFGPCPVVAS